MATNVREKMKSLSAARRKRIEAHAAELVAQEMTLRELRQALTLTQTRIAETLGIGQDGVSRLEKRSDLLLSGSRCMIAVREPTFPALLLSSHEIEVSSNRPSLPIRLASRTR